MSTQLEEFVRQTLDEIVNSLPIEKRLEGLTPEQRLQGLTPEQRLQGLSPEQIRAALETLRSQTTPPTSAQ